jgi:hypothetical protein
LWLRKNKTKKQKTKKQKFEFSPKHETMDKVQAALTRHNAVLRTIEVHRGCWIIKAHSVTSLPELFCAELYQLNELTQYRGQIEITIPICLTHKILDSIRAKHSWIPQHVDRSIDHSKLANVLYNKDKKLQWVIQTIVNNTIYVRYDDFRNKLMAAVASLPKQFNLYLNSHKIGSEHMATMIVWPLMRDRVVTIINNSYDIDNDLPIVMFDDAMYTGINICSLIGDLVKQHNEMHSTGTTVPITFHKVNTTINVTLRNRFIVVAPYVNKQADYFVTQFARDTYVDIIIYTSEIICPMAAILVKSPDSKFYGMDYESSVVEYLSEHFGTAAGMGLYLDHSTGNQIGTFTTLYRSIMKSLPSRELSEKFELELCCIENLI